MPLFRSLAALGVFALLLAACDTTTVGLPPDDARPSVTAFALTPDTDSLGTDASTASVPLQIAMTVAGTGPVRVRALVRYTGELLIPSDFPTGTYTLHALAVDRAATFSEPRVFTFTVE